MIIGINAAAAVRQPRTGVEQYSYQLIKHLTMLPEARKHRFFLYVPNRKNQKCHAELGSASFKIPKRVRDDATGEYFDFPLPENFEIKVLRWPLPFLWTQLRLAWEMLVNPPDVLFIPVHVLPFFAPKRSAVAIHGLEYEYWPKYYSFQNRFILRLSTRRAARRAKKIIAISESTKHDLVKLYGVDQKKIEVVYHGIDLENSKPQSPMANEISNSNNQIKNPYLLSLGRIETKKNIKGILDAYEILKNEYKIPHKLVLAGGKGFGYKTLKREIEKIKTEIKELGYVSEEEKQQLLKNASVFLFPSFYEGFGLPILEAQAAGVPVVTSFNSSLPEVAREGAFFVNPQNPRQIAEAVKKIIDDKALRDKLTESGFQNIKRFNWGVCVKETLAVLEKL